MAFVPGFRLTERIYESDNSLLIRAVRDSDGLPVVIKILKNDFPSREELARYRREFEIIGELEAPGVIRAYELRRHEKTLLMVLEDFGATSVAQLLQERALSVEEFLDAAIQITRALDLIHRANIIHKDITPHNVVINPATGEVKIIDFGIATRFSREKPTMRSPEVLEGTLPYMSPEQTGRMNRTLDARSDFYALGATLYEMLTGARPFDADDKLELVHCHIAREPVPPHRRSPDVPLALSKIVGKLMAKKAEDRYQSAAGLLADLEAMRHGAHAERFEPGLRDQSDRFHIPERLYGRDDEVARLLDAFERTRRGPAELMLISGYSGVGKSALVHETHKPITRARGYFVSGKFDQFQRNTPYAGFATAMRDLVRQILTESDERLAVWRRDLNEALAPNAQAVIDLVPELELIIGPQPRIPELGGAEAKNRFHRVIGQFLHALSSRDSPIVAFLDDLQWADTATLNLLRFIFAEADLERFLVIGAYRDNEVDAMHPLRQALKEIEAGGGRMESVTLRPLGLPDVARLLSDTLKADAAELTGFARLVVQKTQGNPLFVRQFLQDLHREGLIAQTPATATDRARWTWDLAAIRGAGVTDNVVDLLLRRMRQLAPETQEALRIASCIGNRFDLGTLALILKSSVKDAFDRLRQALEEELIRPGSDLTAAEAEDPLSPLVVHEFVFQHDRVQQAAYSLLDADGLRAVHLTIGRRLLGTLPPEALRERIFEVVDHLNFAREMIESDEERLAAAALNLEAAVRASDATAYATALTLARTAQDLLGPEGWRDAYDLARDVFRLRAELEYLNANYDACSEVVAETLENVRTDLERAEVYFTRIAQHTMLAQFAEAVEAGFKALSLVGVSLPRENLQEAGQKAIGEAAHMLAERTPASLLDLPPVDSPEMALAQGSLRHLTIAAFLANQELWPLVVGTSVKLSLEHGNAPESALSYANFGLILGAFMGRFHDGAAFGDLALRLCDRFEGRAPNATVRLVVGSELLPWVAHVDEAIPVIDQGIQEGLDSGEILWVGYLAMYRVLLDAFAGARLEDVLEELVERLEFTDRTRNQGASAGIRAYQIVLSTLAGRSKSSMDFAGPGIDEAEFLALCEQSQLAMARCLYKVLKAQALYLFGRPKEALDATLEVEDQLNFIINHPNLADHRLYQSLALTALHPSGDPERDAETLERLRSNLAQLAVWAEACPANYLAKRLMVEAEIARIEGDAAKATDLYDAAIEAAHESRFLHDEALANELAARFVKETRPKSRVGSMYLRDAHYAYRLWGASRKVEELEMEFPELLTEYRDLRGANVGTLDLRRQTVQPTASLMSPLNLDIDTLIKAGQTISGEVVFGRLLDRLLSILIENAGAQRGVLVLARGEELFVEAEANIASDEAQVLMSVPVASPEGVAMLPVGVINFAARTGEVVVLDEAQRDERFMNDPYVQRRETRSLLCQPIMNQGKVIGLVYLENDLTSAAFTPERAHLVSLLSGQIAISIRNAELVENLEEKVRERTDQLEMHSRFIEQTFGRYLSSQIVDRLLKSPDGLDFRGRNATVTVMSADLRGFTTFSDTLPPETIVKLLNNYLSEMTLVIEKYNGTIDAFIGDSIMTIFGVPFQRPDDAERAVACALEMQLAMSKVNAWNAQNGLPDLEMGIGIATGEVVVGNIGSRKRAKYGVVGSKVNLAVRVEGYTVGGQVLITEETRDAVQGAMTLRDAGTVEPKGVVRPVRLFDVTGLAGRYGLALPERDVQWTTLEPPAPLSIRFVIDKKVVGPAHSGVLMRLSPAEAHIRCAANLPLSTDLQLELSAEDGKAVAGGIYGKVTDAMASEGTVALRFTAMPPDARAALDDLRERNQRTRFQGRLRGVDS